MAIDSFPQEVAESLGHYVYRLIDPRNGETFYVGRGQGNRVFAHAKGELDDSDQSVADPKLERIHEIHALGMNVAHIIHRHRMQESGAKEVEAALIDAYPGLTNRMAGSDSKDRGTRHVDEIVLEYGAEEFVVSERLILISIGRMWNVWGVYEAVRGLWSMDLKKVSQYSLVLAHVRGLVRGAYRPTKWMKGTPKNFPLHDWTNDPEKYLQKVCFNGDEADLDVKRRYVGKRVPEKYRSRGNPIRYFNPN